MQAVGVGFGDPSALPLAARRDFGQFLGALGQDGAVAHAQGLECGFAHDLALAAIDLVASLLQQGFEQARPAVVVGLDNEAQFAQQLAPAELVPAFLVAEVGGPAVMHQRAARARNESIA